MGLRRWLACAMALTLGCGDDVPPGDGESGTGSTAGETTFASLSGAPTTSVDVTTSVDSSGPGTSETTTGTSEGESTSTTGDPVDPFGPAIEIPLGIDFEPLALALADFDGDGVLDLLVTGTDGGVVTGATLLGDGAGGFGAPIDAGVTACSAFPIHGAIDDDGADDLFFGTCGVDAVAYTADGDGTFTAIDLLDDWTFAPVRSSRLADHDGDGDQDLTLLTVDGMDQVRVHVAAGGGAPPWDVTTTELGVSDNPSFLPNILTTGDLDADALADAVLVQVDSEAAWFHGLAPAGHDGDAAVFVLNLAPSTVLARRLLGDDDIDDVVFAGRESGVLQVVRGADGGPGLPEDAVSLGGIVPLEVAAGDFDGDGDDDLASVDVTLPTFVVLDGAGAAQFSLGIERELPALAVRLLAGDLNGDGRSDLVAATFANGTVTALLAESLG